MKQLNFEENSIALTEGFRIFVFLSLCLSVLVHHKSSLVHLSSYKSFGGHTSII